MMSMKLYYVIFILLVVHISCYCFYEGKASQSFCSRRKVDISEVSEEYLEYFPQYKCCYIDVVVEGNKIQGCFTTSPSIAKDIPACTSYNADSNSNPNGNFNGDDDEDTTISIFRNYNEYLLTKLYKIIILSLLILY